MNSLIDKVIIFFISFSLYMQKIENDYMVVPILIIVFLSSIISYKNHKNILEYVSVFFLFLCLSNTNFVYFIPLICYDLFFYKVKWMWTLLLLPLIIHFHLITSLSKIIIISHIVIGYILKFRTISYENIKKNYYKVSDLAKELSIQFKKKNKELLDNQDYEINLATLTERNRIARDIHDNVGHLLSRCLLQIGALLSINKDERNRESLTLIKNTLSEAMDSIRNSVHDLHEDSINLQIEIQKLIDNFQFCNIRFEYDMDSSPPKKIKYCFISIIKEALSNVIKHSNASEVVILLKEHPGLYQLVIKDNGSNINYNIENGIGIKNINDRVSTLSGSVNVSCNNGFRIFVSIQKQIDRMV